MDDEIYMRLALEQALRAGRQGEVPVGAVVVGRDGEVLGRGYNRPIGTSDPTAHAEIVALRDAAAAQGNYRLSGAAVFTTVEPCLMCIGAMLHARVERVVFAAADPKLGWTERIRAMQDSGAEFNHPLETRGGVLAEASACLLTEFFEERRGADAPVGR